VVPVFEHHDRFAMYDRRLSDWTAAKMGPKRDLVGDLGKAVCAQGLYFGASFHRVEHNFFFDRGRTIESDVNDPKFRVPGLTTGLPVLPRLCSAIIQTSCGSTGGSVKLICAKLRLAGRPATNSSSEFLSLVGDVAADLFPTFRSKEDSKSDADADSQEQRHCRAKTRTILPGDCPRGSPDAPAGRFIHVLGSVGY
jgi:hypothetical protein